MKEWTETKVIVKLEPAEEEAVDIVLGFLERMSYLYEEEDVEEIYMEFDEHENKTPIVIGTAERAIQALEEIAGTWA